MILSHCAMLRIVLQLRLGSRWQLQFQISDPGWYPEEGEGPSLLGRPLGGKLMTH